MSRHKVAFKRLANLNSQGRLLRKVSFKELCTFKCGGEVTLLEVSTLDNFLKVMRYLDSLNAKYYMLGAGSNVLCSDKGYDGLVIKLIGDMARVEYDGEILECGAGCRLIDVFVRARDLGLSGLEDGAGIPASIGGATYMNAGAYNFEMSKVVDYVVAYVNGKITYFENSECNFAYRSSVFQKNNAIILRVGLRLQAGKKDDIQYRYLEVLSMRRESQPLDYPSAGCIFRRQEGVNVSKLIDDCGLKGLNYGGAQVSNKHANFIVNMGGASSQDIFELIKVVKKRVFEKTQIDINTEIEFLGEFDENTW